MIKKIIPNIVCFSISFLPFQLGITILKLAIENIDIGKGEIDRAFSIFIIMVVIAIAGIVVVWAIVLAVIAFKSLKKIKEDKKLYTRILIVETTLYMIVIIMDIVLWDKIKRRKKCQEKIMK